MSRSQITYTKREQDIATRFTHHLKDLLPESDCLRALVTCQFTMQGALSVGVDAKNWGRWIRTRLFTNGVLPPIQHAWQKHQSGWIGGDSIEAANAILSCFGLTLDQVLDQYGEPHTSEKYSVKLVDILDALFPANLQSAAA